MNTRWVIALVTVAVGCGRTLPGDVDLDEGPRLVSRSTAGVGASSVSSGAPSSMQATSVPTTSFATTSMATSSAATTSASTTSASSSGHRTANDIYQGNSSIDGAIVSDGTHVYWVMQSPQNGGLDLMICPVTGCPMNEPTVFQTDVNWGDGLGELVIADGSIYFQLGGLPAPIVDCPLGGCGAGPRHFADVGKTDGFSAALATDGSHLYWADRAGIHSCAAAATCSLPSTVARLSSERTPTTLVASGANLYWVNESAATVETVPNAGGTIATVCALDQSKTVASTLAVVGGHAYVAGAWGGSVTAGIQRCALEGGGAATSWVTSSGGAENVATDGAYLYWITGASAVLACALGAACDAPTTLPGPGNVGGFVPSGGYAYWTTLAVGRVPLP